MTLARSACELLLACSMCSLLISIMRGSQTRETDEVLAKRKKAKPPGWTKGLVKVTTKAKFVQSLKWIFGMAFVSFLFVV